MLLAVLVEMVVIDQLRGRCHNQIALGKALAEAFEEGVFQAERELWRSDDRDVQTVRGSFQLLYNFPLGIVGDVHGIKLRISKGQ